MSEDEKRMSFTEHLGELRTRIIRSCIALTVSVIACYIFSNQIFELLAWPLKPLSSHGIIQVEEEQAEGEPSQPVSEEKEQDLEWTVLNPLEFIFVKIRIAGYGGLVVALPFILWQLCAFIFPGLYENERRVIQILMAGCSALGVLGVGVAYFGVFPLVLPYLLEWIPEWVQVQLRLNETLSIIIKGLFGFAIAFQFPMAVLILVYLGLLTPKTLKQYRKMAIIGMAVVAAILTPPDPFSMLVMLLPLALLYESSIWMSYLVIRRRRKAEAE